MMNMDSKYDNMHTNGIFCALIYTNNHVTTRISFILSLSQKASDICKDTIVECVNSPIKKIYTQLIKVEFKF